MAGWEAFTSQLLFFTFCDLLVPYPLHISTQILSSWTSYLYLTLQQVLVRTFFFVRLYVHFIPTTTKLKKKKEERT